MYVIISIVFFFIKHCKKRDSTCCCGFFIDVFIVCSVTLYFVGDNFEGILNQEMLMTELKISTIILIIALLVFRGLSAIVNTYTECKLSTTSDDNHSNNHDNNNNLQLSTTIIACFSLILEYDSFYTILGNLVGLITDTCASNLSNETVDNITLGLACSETTYYKGLWVVYSAMIFLWIVELINMSVLSLNKTTEEHCMKNLAFCFFLTCSSAIVIGLFLFADNELPLNCLPTFQKPENEKKIYQTRIAFLVISGAIYFIWIVIALWHYSTKQMNESWKWKEIPGKMEEMSRKIKETSRRIRENSFRRKAKRRNYMHELQAWNYDEC